MPDIFSHVKVVKIVRGAINGEVTLELPDKIQIVSIKANGSAESLG